MSAFMVTKHTIDNVVALAKPMHMSGDSRATEFGAQLIVMNANALGQRYDLPQSEIDDYALFAKEYVFEERKDSEVQLLKSLHCFLYQCTEGDVPKEELFKELNKLSGVVTDALCKGRQRLRYGEYEPAIDGYDEAVWDIA